MGRAKQFKKARKITKELEKSTPENRKIKPSWLEWIPFYGWWLKKRRLCVEVYAEHLRSESMKYAKKEIERKIVYGG